MKTTLLRNDDDIDTSSNKGSIPLPHLDVIVTNLILFFYIRVVLFDGCFSPCMCGGGGSLVCEHTDVGLIACFIFNKTSVSYLPFANLYC